MPRSIISSILQAKRGLKFTPLFAWLSCWMKKLRPKSSANIAYIFPASRENTPSQTRSSTFPMNSDDGWGNM